MDRFRLKGAYASINLDNIIHNYKEACRQVGPKVTVACVVKSDAYGHGEKQVVQALSDNGLSFICVSTMIEAIRLRRAFPDIEILILGYTPGFLAHKTLEYNLIQTISTTEEARRLNREGRCKVHIKVNTGMNRLGFSVTEIDAIEEISQLENIEICGIFTHLHSSDSRNHSTAQEQYKQFCRCLDELDERHVEVGTRHVCNSGGIIGHSQMHQNMVREGIMLYGMYPSIEVNRDHIKLKECMEYRAYIASLSEVKKGEGISYGHSFIADRDMKVAVVNLGYSDGLFRQLSNKGEVIIGDRRCPIVGRVCMNMFVVDITGLKDVKVEDDVIIFGRSGDLFISIDEVAAWAGTISYEVVCRTGYSVPRAYIRNNEIIEVEEDLIIKVM